MAPVARTPRSGRGVRSVCSFTSTKQEGGATRLRLTNQPCRRSTRTADFRYVPNELSTVRCELSTISVQRVERVAGGACRSERNKGLSGWCAVDERLGKTLACELFGGRDKKEQSPRPPTKCQSVIVEYSIRTTNPLLAYLNAVGLLTGQVWAYRLYRKQIIAA
jgi:hypothetical protein